MDKILIRKRPGDWIARLASNAAIWGAGATPEEAEQSLRRGRPEIPADLPVEVDPDDTAERDWTRATNIVRVMLYRQGVKL